MDYDNLTDVDFADLFLIQEPTYPPSPPNEPETAHERVEERIRQLQGVTARAGQRQSQRCERNSVEFSHFFSDILVDTDVERGIPIPDEIDNIGTVEVGMNAEKRRSCKRDSSHLVAKALSLALAMDSPAKKGGKEGGSIYDCNICLDLAKDPVVTCCGHLFCWACFYQVGYVDSNSRECPVCKGEVSRGNVIPIYGNSGNVGECETESGLKVPPRPKARRVESARQPD